MWHDSAVAALRILPHAARMIVERDLPVDVVEATLKDPARIARLPGGRAIYMRRYFDAALQRDMLLRAVVENIDGEKAVITAYRTSEIEKFFPWVSE